MFDVFKAWGYARTLLRSEKLPCPKTDMGIRKSHILNKMKEELKEVINEGCQYIQFDEPVWTEDVNTTIWGAEILNYIIEKFPGIKFNLHVCGGNAHRKRGYFGRYTDMVNAFKKLKIEREIKHGAGGK